MSITVYTYNDKVLKNVTTDKWLQKKEVIPVGFVMNANNATVTVNNNVVMVSWESPSYPANYNGNGKHYSIINNNTASAEVTLYNLNYSNSTTGSGVTAIPSTAIGTIGTSTGTMTANSATTLFGKYLTMGIGGTEETVNSYLANLTIIILD